MTKAKSLRKSTKKKIKRIRQLNEGKPRRKTNNAHQVRMMKEFNKFIQEQIEAQRLTSHEDVGLPNIINDVSDLVNDLVGDLENVDVNGEAEIKITEDVIENKTT